MDKMAVLILGGAVGTLARYGLSGFILQRLGTGFPWGTMAVNLIGCFLVGFLDILIERKTSWPANMRIMAISGFCGAFTTFSALILESYALLREGEVFKVILNTAGSVVIGLLVFRLGMKLAEAIF